MTNDRQKTNIANLKEFRNKTAHGVTLEISEQQFEKQMKSLQKIAVNLFHSFDDMIQAWEEKFANYRCITDKDIPALMQRYEAWSKDVLEVLIILLSFQKNRLCVHVQRKPQSG